MKFCSVFGFISDAHWEETVTTIVLGFLSPLCEILLLSNVQVLAQTFPPAQYLSQASLLFKEEGGLKDLPKCDPCGSSLVATLL